MLNPEFSHDDVVNTAVDVLPGVHLVVSATITDLPTANKNVDMPPPLMRACTHTCMRTHTHARAHTYTNIHTHAGTHTHSNLSLNPVELLMKQPASRNHGSTQPASCPPLFTESYLALFTKSCPTLFTKSCPPLFTKSCLALFTKELSNSLH